MSRMQASHVYSWTMCAPDFQNAITRWKIDVLTSAKNGSFIFRVPRIFMLNAYTFIVAYLLLYICTFMWYKKWWIVIYRRKFYLTIIEYFYLVINNIHLLWIIIVDFELFHALILPCRKGWSTIVLLSRTIYILYSIVYC
jgi:hypothetical protein